MLDIVVGFVLSSAFIVLFSLFLAYCFRKNTMRFEQVLPISLLSISLLMFLLTVIFHNIQLAFVLTIAVPLIGLGIFIALDKDRKDTVVAFLKSPSIIVFAILLAALFVINYARILTGFDDLLHWGPFVSDMLRLNDFYSSSANTVFSVHGDYPPAAAMFEVFFLKMTMNAQWLMFVASQLLCLSLFFPLFAKFTWNKKTKLATTLNLIIVTLLVIAALLSVTLQADSAFFYEIRIDTLLACAGAYGIYLAFTEGKKFATATVVKLSILVTFMLLLKQVAIVMVAVLVTIYLLMLFAHRNDGKQTSKAKKKAVRNITWPQAVLVIAAVLLPLVFVKLWDVQAEECLGTTICTQQFSGSVSTMVKAPLVILGVHGTELQHDTASNFFNYIYTGETLISSDVLKLTYPQFILLFIGVMLAFVAYAYKKKQRVADILIITITMLVGYFGYLYILLVTYLYGGFSEGEMQILASADRYIGTYILMMILVMLVVFIELWARANEGRTRVFIPGAITLLVLALLLNPVAYKSIMPYMLLNYTDIYSMQEFKEPIDKAIETIKTDEEYDELSVVVLAQCNEQAGLWESNYLRYHLRPNPYLALQNRSDAPFVRNVDYSGAPQYVDPAGRESSNSEGDTTVYVVAMCNGIELEKYNEQDSKLIHFDNTQDIKQKWQVFKAKAPHDYYNTLDHELTQLQVL